jgi:3-oxoacyl-[acyl-carrier-protein] synthase-3
VDAYLKALAVHLPERVVTNAELGVENPDWDMPRLEEKIGIKQRHIAAPGETASDLAHAAAKKLLERGGIAAEKVDALLLCTSSPDYVLPTSACVLQDRLKLPVTTAALDFNQGCSGYVYGLYLAKGLVASGMAKNVLLLTGETYSKYIHPRDRSVRMLFGDAGTATWIGAEPGGAKLGAFRLGTDGSGSNNLIVPVSGARRRPDAASKVEHTDENGSTRTDENLFMDGQEVFNFTLKRVPPLVASTLEASGCTLEQVRWFVFHQANAFMNERLRAKLKIPPERAPLTFEKVGNTVSATLPLTLHQAGAQFQPGDKAMLVGFGVGYSWGACMLEWESAPLRVE